MDLRKLKKYGYYIYLNDSFKSRSYLEFGEDGLDKIFYSICVTSSSKKSVNHFLFISLMLTLIRYGSASVYDPVKDLEVKITIANSKNFALIKDIDEYEYYLQALYSYILEKDKELANRRNIDRLSRQADYQKGI